MPWIFIDRSVAAAFQWDLHLTFVYFAGFTRTVEGCREACRTFAGLYTIQRFRACSGKDLKVLQQPWIVRAAWFGLRVGGVQHTKFGFCYLNLRNLQLNRKHIFETKEVYINIVCAYIYIYIYICMCVYVYIYMEIKRRQGESHP